MCTPSHFETSFAELYIINLNSLPFNFVQKSYEEEIERLRKEKKEMEEKMEREMGDMRKKMANMKTEVDKAAKVDKAHYLWPKQNYYMHTIFISKT